LVHGQVTIIFVVSVCLSVCLCRVFLSRLWSDLDQTRTHVTRPGFVVSLEYRGSATPGGWVTPKNLYFRGFRAAVNHYSVAASYYYCYRPSIAWSVGRSVCLSVCLSVCHISQHCKNGSTDRDATWDEPMRTRLGPRNRVLDEVCRSSRWKGQFWGREWATHCKAQEQSAVSYNAKWLNRSRFRLDFGLGWAQWITQ